MSTGGEPLLMEWFEAELDAGTKKGLAVQISIAGEVVYYYAVSQDIQKYRRTDCVKSIFYWLIDNDILDEVDLSPMINPPTDRLDIPF